jgi:hypothetical protein
MGKLEQMEQWHQDLVQIAVDHEMSNDPAIANELSLVAIELDALKVHLPDSNEALNQAVARLHAQRITERCLSLLQSILGYYTLPDQPKGHNEPIIGSLKAHEIRTSLMSDEIDIYETKERLAYLLRSAGDES